jgi:hypothetical protein
MLGWNMIEQRSEMAVVNMPASWIEECVDFNGSQKSDLSGWMILLLISVFVIQRT